jgi:hypothetical protein
VELNHKKNTGFINGDAIHFVFQLMKELLHFFQLMTELGRRGSFNLCTFLLISI